MEQGISEVIDIHRLKNFVESFSRFAGITCSLLDSEGNLILKEGHEGNFIKINNVKEYNALDMLNNQYWNKQSQHYIIHFRILHENDFVLVVKGLELEAMELVAAKAQCLQSAITEFITNDILNLKLEDELENHERYKYIVENSPIGIYQREVDGKYLYVNKGTWQQFGCESEHDFLAQYNILENRWAHPEYYKEFKSLLMNNGSVNGFEMESNLKNGNKKWFSLYAIISKDSRTISGYSLDITEIKEAEQELREYRDHLEKLVNERTRELVGAMEKAEAANIAKSQFLANMSHEIRTPMNAVIGFTDLIIKTEMTEKQRGYISKINFSARSLLGIINDVLDYSKIEAGKLDIEKVNFKLDSFIESIVDMISVKAIEKGLELICHIDSEIHNTLIGDSLRLGQVLINLMNNAVKFTSKGYVMFEARLIETSDDRCYVRFTIRDTGIGIEDEVKERLFQSFTQGDSSITRQFGGTGLGLAISKSLVDMMGGKLEVTSHAGLGSAFSFQVDLGYVEDTSQPKNIPKAIESLKVLIVDDIPNVLEVIQDQLKTFNINACSTRTGGEAFVELARADNAGEPYDLVLLDYFMPEMNGREVAKYIHRKLKLKQKPEIIMMSAFSREDVVNASSKLGIKRVLQKPISSSLLFETMLEHIGMKLKPEIDKNIHNIKNHSETIYKGKRILLVEDNVLNQEVALEMLESAEIDVIVASNGAEAIALLGSESFNLILMDLQMPIMGGKEATRIIRGKKEYKNLPIIAMTADAMKGTMQECIELGMNDFITKPLDFEEVLKKIGRYMESSIKNFRVDTDLRDDTLYNIKLANSLKLLDIKQALDKMLGNKQLYLNTLQTFVRTQKEVFEKIGSLIRVDEMEEAIILVHTLKGLVGSIGAVSFQKKIQSCELVLKDNLKTEAEKIIDTIEPEFKLLLKEINSVLEENQNLINSEIRKDTDSGKLIEEFSKLVFDDDPIALALFNSNKALFERVFHKYYSSIHESISNFDFETVQNIINQFSEIKSGGCSNE